MIKQRFNVIIITIMIVIFSVAVLAARPVYDGKYNAAEFIQPDFTDGDSVILNQGEARTFTYTCTCSNERKDVDCAGTMYLQMDDGNGFNNIDMISCNVPKGSVCTGQDSMLFDTAGNYEFRIFCDEASGTDYIQSSTEYVTVQVQEIITCTNGETRPCPLQVGVCQGSEETCLNNLWSGCNYSNDYEEPENSCDGLDNDCDGLVDNVDKDEDGYNICPQGPGIINELLLTNTNGEGGRISVFEYKNGLYEEAWTTTTPDVTSGTRGGGEMGDLTGDGIPEIALARILSSGVRLEIWNFDAPTQGWSRMWASQVYAYPGIAIGDIADFDNDGTNELLLTNGDNQRLDIYTWNNNEMIVEYTVRDCSPLDAYFHSAGADLDNDGTLEIFFQCNRPENMKVHEFDGNMFATVGTVELPPHADTIMLVDDMEGGDVDGDNVDELVFCGSTSRGYVISYTNTSNYTIEYTTPQATNDNSFTQTCSVGDMTNDGQDDFLVINQEGAKVYTYNGNSYEELWVGNEPQSTPNIGTSFIGDSDNDGFVEFLFADSNYFLYGSDTSNANSFSEEETFSHYGSGGTIIIGNMNPYNDQAQVDCDDNNPNQGVHEICGDSLDNDCDNEIDEDCPVNFCGDGFCSGEASGETCSLCSADCACLGPDCKHGCCGDGVCGKLETSSNCQVDCA